MSDLIPLMHRWLDVIARGAVDEWPGIVSRDVVVRLPFAPPGIDNELRGLDAARAAIGAFWKTIEVWRWHDLVILRTEDPQLLVATARSEARTVAGHAYANSYVIFTRFTDDQVVEHIEYFNPLPVLAMVSGET